MKPDNRIIDLHPSRQSGMTLIGFLLMFVLIGFFALLIVKLAPIYLEYYKIHSILNDLKSESGLFDKTPKEITYLLQKRWDVNSVDRIKADQSLFFERHGGNLKVQVAYEVEEHLLGNVSVLVKFDDSINVGDSD